MPPVVADPERTLVGLATFDAVLHFYAFKPAKGSGASSAGADGAGEANGNASSPSSGSGGGGSPQMLVVTDVGGADDVFAPAGAPLMLPLTAGHRAGLQALLASLPGMLSGAGPANASAGGAAIEVGCARLLLSAD
jgi:hypothetical protein